MLNKPKLQNDIKKDIKKIEDILYESLNDKEHGIYNVQKRLDEILSKDKPTSEFNVEEFKKRLWEKTSEEWAKSLSKQIIEVLSKELSIIISDRLTEYIKSADIIIPQGQGVQVQPSTMTGVTVSPSPKANIN